MQGRKAVVAVLAGWTLACGGLFDAVEEKVATEVAEAVIESQGGGENVEIDRDGEGLSFKTKDGEMELGGKTKLPEDFPFTAMAEWPAQMKVRTNDGTMVTLSVPVSIEEAAKTARAELARLGCPEPEFVEMPHMTMLSCKGADGAAYSINLTGDGEKRAAMVTYSPPEE